MNLSLRLRLLLACSAITMITIGAFASRTLNNINSTINTYELPTSFTVESKELDAQASNSPEQFEDTQNTDTQNQDTTTQKQSSNPTPKTVDVPVKPVDEDKADEIPVETPCVDTLQAKIIRSYTFNNSVGEIPGQFRASYEPICNDPGDVSFEWHLQGLDYNINSVSGLMSTASQPSFSGYQDANYRLYLRVTSATLGWSQIETWIRVTNGRPNAAPVVSIQVPSYNGVPYTRNRKEDGSTSITFYTSGTVNDYYDRYVEHEKIQWFFERQNGERILIGQGDSLYYVDFTLPSCQEDTFKLVLKATDWAGLVGEQWLERSITGECS